MNKKELALNAIRLKKVDRVPVVYRATKNITEILLKYFGFKNCNEFALNYKSFLEKIRADFWGMGHNICYFSSFCPRYIGPKPKKPYIEDMLLYYTIGINAIEKRIEKYDYSYPQFVDPPLGNIERPSDITENFLISKLKLFDFKNFNNLYYYHKNKTGFFKENKDLSYSLEIKTLKKENEFIGIGTFNSPFI